MGGRIVALICVSLFVVGCAKKPELAVAKPKPTEHIDWPADSLEKPEFVGVVDRKAGHIKGDAEPTRIPSAYQIPDWSEPTSPISVKGPKGARLTFHLLPRTPSLKKQDDARVQRLLKGKKQGAETLFVARPWIGWYGQGSGVEALPENKQRPYTLRVYNLFQEDQMLEIHLEWPTGVKPAYDEGQELLAYIVYSVQRS
jgi:hypothetical protein